MTIRDEYVEDVMVDLGALVDAGEASAGSAKVVEEYRKAHPGVVGEMKERLAAGPPEAVRQDEEMAALRRTRQAIRLRSVFMAMGIAFTLLPLSVRGGAEGVRFVFFPHETGVIAAFWSIAAASWVAMWVMGREVRRRGL